MLLSALTPNPRYIRAKPASKGFGEAGSGPGRKSAKAEYPTMKLTPDEPMQGFQRATVLFACECPLLDLRLYPKKK